MAVDLIIAREAEQDLDEAYSWYEQQRPGLGEDFLGRVEACIQTLLRNPELHAPFQGEFRRALLRKFPYAVFYEFTANTVHVYGVFHTSSDPAKWKRRLY